MNKNLSTKLIFPMILIGFFYALASFFLPESISKYNVFVIIIILL